MRAMRKTIIIVPCYNESKRLRTSDFLSAVGKDEDLVFLLVDDGSSDGTLDILKNMHASNPHQISYLHLQNNSGKAEAVRRGVLKACMMNVDRIGYWDADLSTPLDIIADFSNVLDTTDADIVIGSRVRLLGKIIERRAFRHYLGRLFATCASIFLGIGIYDTQCGAKLFRNTSALKRVFSKPFKVKWIFEIEMLSRFPIVTAESITEASSRWVEYPLGKWVDQKGSKVGSKDYFKCIIEFMTLLYFFKTPARQGYLKYLLDNDASE